MHSVHAAVAPERPRRPSAAATEVIDCDVRLASPKPLHVACALGGTDLGRSGIGTYVREVLPPLIRELTDTGGRLTVFGHADELEAYRDALAGAQRKRVLGLPLAPAANALWHLARAAGYARRCHADALLLPAANRRITRFGGSLPTVAVVHDLAQLRVAQKYDPLRMAYFHRVLLPAFHRPSRLVAVSGATRDDLVGKLGIDPARIRVVYNGVNTAQFRSLAPSAVRRTVEAHTLHERPYLLYPARLEHPGKNHVRLLAAFAASGLADTHTLAFSGADWGGGDVIRRAVQEYQIERAVRFLGFVPANDLPALIAGADAVLMLGLHEGFGLPALEGLSAGRPVCVSSTGALPEVVGALGVQCDPLHVDAIATGLRRVIHDAPLRLRCEREGPTWADRFSWTRTAHGLLEACREAVE